MPHSIFAILCLVLAYPAQAQSIDFGDHRLSLEKEVTPKRYADPPQRPRLKPVARAKPRAPAVVTKRRTPAVAAWQMRMPSGVNRFMAAGQCSYPIAISGSVSLNDALAESSAQKAWREQVEMDLGQAYMDMDNAVDYYKYCTTASAGGVAGELQRRCKIIAVPCRPPLIDGK